MLVPSRVAVDLFAKDVPNMVTPVAASLKVAGKSYYANGGGTDWRFSYLRCIVEGQP